MLRVLGCITQQHDLRLVGVAAFLCAFSCWTTVTILSRSRAGEGRSRAGWTIAAAFVFGAGVWATHFVGMLAFQTAFPVSYALGWTFLSIGIAVVLSGGAFALLSVPGMALFSGILIGIAISAMHYTGMQALQGDFRLAWDWQYVLASIAVSIIAGIAAMRTFDRAERLRGQWGAAALLTSGIIAMHFTGMSATMLVPDPSLDFHGTVVAADALAVSITAIAILIVALGQISAQLDGHLASRRREEDIRQKAYIAELEKAKRDLSRAVQTASAANETKSAFLATMSHELRTPLNAIIGFAELMQNAIFGPIGNARYAEYVGDIRDSGVHLLSLINDILDLSRLDAGKADLAEEDFSLKQLIEECCRSLQPLTRQDHIQLAMTIAPDLPGLRADRRRIKQVIINLLSNAIKFTPENGLITITAAAIEGRIHLTIRDTGIGMSKADLAKALERFGQVDSSMARKHEGTGLGLPLAKQLIELHDGLFEIESEPDVGTIVTIAFPAARVRMASQAVAPPHVLFPDTQQVRRAAG